MAPIAISPQEKDNVQVFIKEHHGVYKDQASGPLAYNKQLEEEGSTEAPKAKVGVRGKDALQR